MDLLKDFDGDTDQSGKTLLLEHFAGIGDMLWRTCLHREIKRRNPDMKLIISSFGPHWKLIWQDNPYIDGFKDKIEGNLDLTGIDYHINDRLCPHVISDYARKHDAVDSLEIWSGLEMRDKSYWYETTEDEDKWVNEFLSKYPRPIVGIQLKSSTWIRTWIPDEVLKLIRLFRYNGFTVVIMDNQQFGFKDPGIINMSGGYNIRQVAAVIKQLDLMVTPDSGLLHFAGHFKIPTVAIFGGSDPFCRLKYYSTIFPVLVKERLQCWPCWSHAYSCKFGIPSPCLSQITVEQVWETVKEIF